VVILKDKQSIQKYTRNNEKQKLLKILSNTVNIDNTNNLCVTSEGGFNMISLTLISGGITALDYLRVMPSLVEELCKKIRQ